MDQLQVPKYLDFRWHSHIGESMWLLTQWRKKFRVREMPIDS